MKNVLLFALIIVAAIFPYAATAIELTRDMTAALALVGMSVLTIAIALAAMFYRPKPTADTETPLQAIPSMPGARRAAAGGKKH